MSKIYEFGPVEVEDRELLWLQPAGSSGWRVVGIERRSPRSFTVMLQPKTYGNETGGIGKGAIKPAEQSGTPDEV